MPPLLSLILPTYNERDSIEEVIVRARRALETAGIDAEILVVDDNSPDGTAQAARRALDDPSRVIVRPEKGGLASAVLEGFRRARGDILGVMDADGSHPPETIPALARPVLSGGADLAVASRYVPGGRIERWTPWRLLASRTACLLAGPLTPIRDATSGFFLVRRRAIEGVDLSSRGFKIGLELYVKGRPRAWCEVPYAFTDRKAGRSKFGLCAIADYLRQLAALAVWKIRDAK